MLPFFIDAWEESIHLVKVSVWSSEPVRVELIPIDPITGTIDEEERTLETLDGQAKASARSLDEAPTSFASASSMQTRC